MTGQILDFSVQTNAGVITGDDGNRYSFTGAGWQTPDRPRLGMRVDFDPDGNTATGIYAAARADYSALPVAAGAGGATAAVVAPVMAPSAGSSGSSMGTAGMIIGLPALVLFWIPLLGWILMVVGLGLSIAALVKGKLRGGQTGFAIAGAVLNFIALSIHNFVAALVTIFGYVWGGIIDEIFRELGPLGDLLKWLDSVPF